MLVPSNRGSRSWESSRGVSLELRPRVVSFVWSWRLSPVLRVSFLKPSPHRDLVPMAVLTDLLVAKILHLVSGVLSWAIPEPSHFDRKSLLHVVLLSDDMGEDSLDRFAGR